MLTNASRRMLNTCVRRSKRHYPRTLTASTSWPHHQTACLSTQTPPVVKQDRVTVTRPDLRPDAPQGWSFGKLLRDVAVAVVGVSAGVMYYNWHGGWNLIFKPCIKGDATARFEQRQLSSQYGVRDSRVPLVEQPWFLKYMDGFAGHQMFGTAGLSLGQDPYLAVGSIFPIYDFFPEAWEYYKSVTQAAGTVEGDQSGLWKSTFLQNGTNSAAHPLQASTQPQQRPFSESEMFERAAHRWYLTDCLLQRDDPVLRRMALSVCLHLANRPTPLWSVHETMLANTPGTSLSAGSPLYALNSMLRQFVWSDRPMVFAKVNNSGLRMPVVSYQAELSPEPSLSKKAPQSNTDSTHQNALDASFLASLTAFTGGPEAAEVDGLPLTEGRLLNFEIAIATLFGLCLRGSSTMCKVMQEARRNYSALSDRAGECNTNALMQAKSEDDLRLAHNHIRPRAITHTPDCDGTLDCHHAMQAALDVATCDSTWAAIAVPPCTLPCAVDQQGNTSRKPAEVSQMVSQGCPVGQFAHDDSGCARRVGFCRVLATRHNMIPLMAAAYLKCDGVLDEVMSQAARQHEEWKKVANEPGSKLHRQTSYEDMCHQLGATRLQIRALLQGFLCSLTPDELHVMYTDVYSPRERRAVQAALKFLLEKYEKDLGGSDAKSRSLFQDEGRRALYSRSQHALGLLRQYVAAAKLTKEADQAKA